MISVDVCLHARDAMLVNLISKQTLNAIYMTNKTMNPALCSCIITCSLSMVCLLGRNAPFLCFVLNGPRNPRKNIGMPQSTLNNLLSQTK